MAKLPMVTRDMELITEVVNSVLGTKKENLSLRDLVDAMETIPISTTLHFDKIFGKWIFSNQEPDQWPKEKVMTSITDKFSFTFCDLTPEKAIGMGMYYYFHYKMDHVQNDFKREPRI